MLEESIPSIWASFHGWFTPAVLFVLLNLVIGTIAVTSSKLAAHSGSDGDPLPRKLARAPSAVLERLRSFNLHRQIPTDIPLEASPPPLETVEAVETVEAAPDLTPQHDPHFVRSRSESVPAAEAPAGKRAAKMRKSASVKVEGSKNEEEEEEEEIGRRPATVREREMEKEEEVDARADDFINRFRQQLKLQRLDSIIRYREMLSRGT